MKKYLARNHKFYIKNLENWVQISGVTNWSISYAKEVEDFSLFNNKGWTSSITKSINGSIVLNGFYLTDASSGVRDYGQYLCELATNELGYHGLRGFKIEAFDDLNNPIGSILCSGVLLTGRLAGGNVRSVLDWSKQVNVKGILIGSGIYNIFSQESYPVPVESGIDRSGMWTGVLGMYTYAE